MEKTITLPALIENIEAVTAFAEEEMELHACPVRSMMLVSVAIDEIFGNIANYAYPGTTGDAMVTIDFPKNPDAVRIAFADHGIPYNPLEKEDPDVSLSAEEREIGGLGIFIVKNKMDEMYYRYENEQNILTIVKYF